MFCVECGKEGPIFRDGVCISCYLKTHSFSKCPEIIDMPVCPHCGSYKHKNTWTSDLFGAVVRRVVKDTFHISNELKRIDINTECKEKKDGMECKVIISGFLDDVEITEEYSILVRMRNTVCDVCSKRFGGYHEAIIQIRADKRKLTKDELNAIRSMVEGFVEHFQTKGNRNLFITDIGEEHGGIDFYISDKNFGFAIAKKIQGQYGGIIKQSSKNIGMKDSRQVYRMTYLLRLPVFSRRDILLFKNQFFYVSSISVNKVHVFNLKNWDELVFDLKDLEHGKIVGNEKNIRDIILISQTKNEIQIMTPDKYNVITLKKPKNIDFEEDKIKIVNVEDKFFIFPPKQNISDK